MIPPRLTPRPARDAAFTLIEIMLASMGAALVLAALYGVFIHAVKLRDTATNRVRDARLRARAEAVIRTDLQNAYLSGGILAATLQGGTNNNSGSGGAGLPGDLKFTTTTGRDTSTDLYGDVQQVEYYLTADPDAPANTASQGGILVRAVTRDLLAAPAPAAQTEQILRGVKSLAVEFYDGSTWQQTWNYDGAAAALTNSSSSDSNATVIALGNTTLPDAVRVSVQQVAAVPGGPVPPPVEVLAPWTTQPFAAATPSTTTAVSAAVTATPTPNATTPRTPGEGPTGGPPPGPPPGNGPPPNGPPPNGPPPGAPPSSGSRSPR